MKQRRYKKPLRKKKPLHRIDDEWIINAMIKESDLEMNQDHATPLDPEKKHSSSPQTSPTKFKSEKVGKPYIYTGDLANESVTNEKLANRSVSSSKIQNDAIERDHLIDNIIDTPKLANASVTAPKIVQGAIKEQHIFWIALGSELSTNERDFTEGDTPTTEHETMRDDCDDSPITDDNTSSTTHTEQIKVQEPVDDEQGEKDGTLLNGKSHIIPEEELFWQNKK